MRSLICVLVFVPMLWSQNHKLTPGVVRTTDARQICAKGFTTKAYRRTTLRMKKQVCAAYGIRQGCPGKTIEIDHLISLELGGADDVRNLWPQTYAPVPGAHQKDLVENWLHREVCAGRIALPEAQRAISTNWLAVYRKMTKLERKASDLGR